MKKVFALGIIISLVVIVSCVPSAIPVTSVSLNSPSLTLTEGESVTLSASILPSDATNKNVTWSSSDETVATVKSGVVTAMKQGSAKITVKTEDGGKTASCSVVVEPKYIAVSGITLDKTSLSMYDDEEITLTATIAPENATEKSITWKSSDESVATVSGGKVTAHKEGSTDITASVENVSAKCVITVNKKIIHVESLSLSAIQKRLKVGESYTIECSVYPSNANDYELTYKSDDESIARVSNDGIITAVRSGKTTIKVTAEGKSAGLSISVFEADDIYYTYGDYNYSYYSNWVYKNDELLHEATNLVINYLFVEDGNLVLVGTEFPATRAVFFKNGEKQYLTDNDGNRANVEGCRYVNGTLYSCNIYNGGHGVWVNNEKKYDMEAISEYSYLNVYDMTVVGGDVYACGSITEPVDANNKKQFPVIWKNGKIYHKIELERSSSFQRIENVNNKLYMLLETTDYATYESNISIWDENGKCYDLENSYYASSGKIYCFNSTLYAAKTNYDDKSGKSMLTVYEGENKLFEIEDIEVANYELDYVDGDIYCLATKRIKMGGDFYYSVHLYRNGVEEKVLAKTQRNPMYARGIKVFAKY